MTLPVEPIEGLRLALADRYTLVRELGRGGMATVYLARDLKHDRDVAIKVLRPELAAALGADRFLAEIRTTANLQHPHILSLFDSGVVASGPGVPGGVVFYVMPFVDGESLRDRLERERQLPVADAVRIAREVADALAHAHQRGIIHRDIKPENILLQGGHALVADFGIALAASNTRGARMTETGMSLGTPHYMSPEQATGERELDARSDVYALGAVLYEMLAGEPPFSGPTVQAIIAKVLTENAPPVRARRPSTPEAVEHAIASALEKLPADRCRSAEAFGAALEVPLSARTTGVRVSTPTLGTSRAWRAWPIAAGAVTVAGAFLLGMRRSGTNDALPLAFGRETHVTWDPALEVTPSLSPDGKNVAYAAGLLMNLHVMVRPIGQGRVQPLTGDTTTVESNPQWSPDGTRVLFLAHDGVFSAPSGGGPPRPEIVGDKRSPIVSAAWAPDSKRITFARGDTLFVRDSSGGQLAVAAIANATMCSWSPAGTFVACMSGNDQYAQPGALLGNRAPSHVMLWRVGSHDVTDITGGTSLNASPVWSPDGAWLYLVSDRDGPRDVYGTRIDKSGHVAGAMVRLTTGLDAHSLSFAANAARMVYSHLGVRSSIWSMPLPRTVSSSVGAKQLSNANENIEAFDVSHDGKWVYYDTDLTGNSDIFRLSSSGGEPQQLTNDAADDFAPTPSPDDREIAYHSWRTGNREIFVQRLDGSKLTQVTRSPQQEATPDWAPDGNALLFADLADGARNGIARRDASGAWGPTNWLPLKGPSGWMSDGRSLAYLAGTAGGDLYAASIDGGSSHLLADGLGPNAPRPVYVTPAGGDTLYYETEDRLGAATIWMTTLRGTPRALVHLDPVLHPSARGGFRIRSGVLYFLVQSRESDVWAMDITPR